MAENRDFDIHGLLRLRIRGLARFALDDLNVKLKPFEAPPRGEPDIFVDIGPVTPDLRGATHVDHQYFLRRGYVYFREDLPGFSFAAEISGLERGPMRVRFQRTRARPSPANLLYRDQILFDHVLQPLLEWRLGLKGAFLMHGGAVARNGAATVLAGRGLSFKTTYCFNLVREGMEFLGDDLILFDGRRLLPFPVYGRYFDFHLSGDMQSESELGGRKKLAMLRHLAGTSPLRYRLSGPCRPYALVLIHPRTAWPKPVLSPLTRDAALAKVSRNIDMERSAPGPAKYLAGRFLDAYAMAFPDHVYRHHKEERSAALAKLFSDSASYTLETDTRWHGENLDALRPAIAGAP